MATAATAPLADGERFDGATFMLLTRRRSGLGLAVVVDAETADCEETAAAEAAVAPKPLATSAAAAMPISCKPLSFLTL